MISIVDHDMRMSSTQIPIDTMITDASAASRLDHAIGALFGEQTGGRVEITSSFEAKIDITDDGRFILDRAFLIDKVKLCTYDME